MLIKTLVEGGGSSVMKSEKLTKPCKSLDVDPFLVLEVFAFDTNRTNINLTKYPSFRNAQFSDSN